MSKIVFFCIPAHGHTNPTLGVVAELIRRGHQVWYYSYSPFREKIEATGATFVACDEFDAEAKLTKEEGERLGDDLALSTRVLVDTTLALDDTVCRHMQEIQPDCIVADSMAVWGKAAARKLGIPFVSSTTTFAFNKESAKVMKQSFGQMANLLFSMGKIQKNIKRLQAAGYPIHSVLDLIQNDNDTDTIVYTSPEFQPCADSFSEKYSFVGPSLRRPEAVIEKTGEKLVYVSLGTVKTGTADFYRQCIQALTGYQVILSVGRDFDISQLGEIPAGVTVAPFVDQMAVLGKADAFVTHCGMNSASEGLAMEVPLVLYPQTTEQGGVARRVEELGAGLRLTEVKNLRQAVDTVLCDGKYRDQAHAIAETFRRCPGAKGAADKIESICRK